MSAVISRIRKTLVQEIDAVYSGFKDREHTLDEVVDSIEAVLRKSPEVMPSVRDLAHMVAHTEDQTRTRTPLPKSLDLFDREWAERAEIALGGNRRITWAAADLNALRQKLGQQIKHHAEGARAMEFTQEVIEIAESDPDAKNVSEAMIRLGKWE